MRCGYILIVRLSNQGQLTNPSEVRESLGLGPGDLIVLSRIEPFDAPFHAALSIAV